MLFTWISSRKLCKIALNDDKHKDQSSTYKPLLKRIAPFVRELDWEIYVPLFVYGSLMTSSAANATRYHLSPNERDCSPSAVAKARKTDLRMFKRMANVTELRITLFSPEIQLGPKKYNVGIRTMFPDLTELENLDPFPSASEIPLGIFPSLKNLRFEGLPTWFRGNEYLPATVYPEFASSKRVNPFGGLQALATSGFLEKITLHDVSFSAPYDTPPSSSLLRRPIALLSIRYPQDPDQFGKPTGLAAFLVQFPSRHLRLQLGGSSQTDPRYWSALPGIINDPDLKPMPSVDQLTIRQETWQQSPAAIVGLPLNKIFPSLQRLEVELYERYEPNANAISYPSIIRGPYLKLTEVTYRLALQHSHTTNGPMTDPLQKFLDRRVFPALTHCSFKYNIGSPSQSRNFFSLPQGASSAEIASIGVEEIDFRPGEEQKLIRAIESDFARFLTKNRTNVECSIQPIAAWRSDLPIFEGTGDGKVIQTQP